MPLKEKFGTCEIAVLGQVLTSRPKSIADGNKANVQSYFLKGFSELRLALGVQQSIAAPNGIICRG